MLQDKLVLIIYSNSQSIFVYINWIYNH